MSPLQRKLAFTKCKRKEGHIRKSRLFSLYPTVPSFAFTNNTGTDDPSIIRHPGAVENQSLTSETVTRLLSLGNGSASNATDLQRKQFPGVHPETVCRALREEGLGAHVRRSVPFISKRNQAKRLAWAKEREHWTIEDWKCVFFSDESIFRLFGSNGREWCWRKPGQGLDPRFTKKKVKHGGGKVTIRALIHPNGPGHIVRIEGNMDRFLYREIMEDDLLGSFVEADVLPEDVYFQQDNDPKHTSKIVKAWFKENNIDVLPWPPQSPDVNIIENLWDYLDRRVRARKRLPSSETELWEILQEEWEALDVEYIRKLYESLPSRIAAVIQAKGGNTRF